MHEPDRLDVFYGELTPALAHVYVRVGGVDPGRGWRLEGTVSGPYSAYARTLPATSRLMELGPGTSLLARAAVPDPCTWSALAPCLYRIQVAIQEGPRTIASYVRELAFRRLGTVGRDLRLEGKRWVLRGVATSSSDAQNPGDWRTAEASLWTADLNDAVGSATARDGVLVVADVRHANNAVEQLRDLAHWPSVAVVVLDRNVAGAGLQQVAPNVILAQAFEVGERIELASWAQLAVCFVGDIAEFARRIQGLALPLIACRPLPEPVGVVDARAACDRLQRDLARHCDLAGYIV